MNIYVIGPVTGKPNDNREEFERVREELWANPFNNAVMIPHDFADADSTWEQAMCQSILAMMQWRSYELSPNIPSQGFAIAMLDDWEESKGARIEHDLAEALGIECRPWREFL